jgi:undecaprenyl-diphosphatase
MDFLKATFKHLHRTSPKWILWAFSLICFGVFIEVFGELHEDEHSTNDLLEFDDVIIKLLFKLRTPLLNAIAVDITALGSTVIVTCVVVFLTILFILRNRISDAIQIAAAGILAGVCSQGFKFLVGRDRPPIASRLVDVQGFSYPSGHSLSAAAIYLTIGLIFFERFYNNKERIFALTSALVLIFAIGISRIYLGVHYPSDVVGGLSLGMGVAFLIFAVRRLFEVRGPRKSKQRQ